MAKYDNSGRLEEVGEMQWRERYSLGQQVVEIAGNLITKQAEKYRREHPRVNGGCIYEA